MARKSIAAFLLTVIAVWAEMTMAPLLAMHAGHMRPGHEMAADMPAAHHPHHHAVQPNARAEQADSHRRCCPGLHQEGAAPALEISAGGPPCADPHSCCFRQGPQSMPAPARNPQALTLELAPVATQEGPVPTIKRTVLDRAPILSPPPEVFGMILRV